MCGPDDSERRAGREGGARDAGQEMGGAGAGGRRRGVEGGAGMRAFLDLGGVSGLAVGVTGLVCEVVSNMVHAHLDSEPRFHFQFL